MFGKKKIDKVNIVKKDGYLLWKEDISNADINTTVVVSNGCMGYYLKNGVLVRPLSPGLQNVIIPKEEKKEDNNYQLYGGISGDVLSFKIGIGGVKYHDDEVNYDTLVGSNADFTVSVIDAWKLKKPINKDEITKDDVIAYTKAKLGEIFKTDLAILLSKYDYLEVDTKLSAMSEDLKNKFGDKLFEIGLTVTDVVINCINFSDEYIEVRKDFLAEQNYEAAQKKQDRRDRYNAQTAAEFLNTVNPNKPAQPSANNSELITCPYCNNQINKAFAHCPYCGKEIHR